jgi:hypothetical protein
VPAAVVLGEVVAGAVVDGCRVVADPLLVESPQEATKQSASAVVQRIVRRIRHSYPERPTTGRLLRNVSSG